MRRRLSGYGEETNIGFYGYPHIFIGIHILIKGVLDNK